MSATEGNKRGAPESGCCDTTAKKQRSSREAVDRSSSAACDSGFACSDGAFSEDPKSLETLGTGFKSIAQRHWEPHNPHRDEQHPFVDEYEDYVKVRKEILKREKQLTIMRDHIARDLQALPWVRVSKDYVFAYKDDEKGPVMHRSLTDMFGDREDLVVYHLMLDEGWDGPCSICSLWLDGFNGQLPHIQSKAAFVCIAKAPCDSFPAILKEKGWHFRIYSSKDNAFNKDFRVEHTSNEELKCYNFGTGWAHPAGQLPGVSIFHKVGDEIFFTNGVYSRGLDALNMTHAIFDMLPYGREGFQAKHKNEY